jgi:hypothetical protein
MLPLCRSCGSSDLRTSRFRLKDLPFLLILHYPMRCWVCRERDYMFIPDIFKLSRDAELRSGGASGIDKAQTQ